jgi:hypothetical protein
LLIDAPTLAVLKDEYGHVMSVEVVVVPTITEEEENQEIDLDGGLSAINE